MRRGDGANIITREVSDGIIAPGYTPKALEILKGKKKGGYNIVKIDKDYKPDPIERKQVFGVTFEQGRNEFKIDADLLKNIVTKNKELPDAAKTDLIVSLITLKYTQSNSVCFAADGQAIGVGAGQQSRIHCTRLAGNKADLWHLRQSDKVLGLQFAEDVSRPTRTTSSTSTCPTSAKTSSATTCGSSISPSAPSPSPKRSSAPTSPRSRACRWAATHSSPSPTTSSARARAASAYVAQPGGSVRDDLVIEACDKYGMVMAFTGMRLFHH